MQASRPRTPEAGPLPKRRRLLEEQEADQIQQGDSDDSGDSSSEWSDQYDNTDVEEAFEPQFHRRRDISVIVSPTFKAWCKEKGIWMHRRLRIRHYIWDRDREDDDHVLVSVMRPNHDDPAIKAGDVVVKVPKHAILSVRTSVLGPHLAAYRPSKTYEPSQKASLDLALCLFYEGLLGAESAFKPYLDTLPRDRVHLPMFRHQHAFLHKAWRWIRGTEAHRIDRRVRIASRQSWKDKYGYSEKYGMCEDTVHEYIDDVVEPLLARVFNVESGPWDAQRSMYWSLGFQDAYTLVSSRSFNIDLYHGIALVPVCDLFDHCEYHTAQFETVEDVCLHCGIVSTTPHPHVVTTKPRGRQKKTPVDTVDLRATRRHNCCDEMFNTYGTLSNAQLLNHYGFCLEGPTDIDRYTFDIRFAKERREVTEALGIRDWQETFDRCFALGRGKTPDPTLSEASARVASLQYLDFRSVSGEDGPVEPLDWDDYYNPLVALYENRPIDVELPKQTTFEQNMIKQDRFQPLFFDSEGHISRALWRLAILAQLKCSSKAPDAKRIMVYEDEMYYFRDCIEEGSWPTPEVKEVSKMVQRALNSLHTLLLARREKMYARQYMSQAKETKRLAAQNSTLLNVLLHASQEYRALTRALRNIERMQSHFNANDPNLVKRESDDDGHDSDRSSTWSDLADDF